MRSPAASPVVMDVFLFIRLTAYERGLDEYWVTPIFYFWIYFIFTSTVWHVGCFQFSSKFLWREFQAPDILPASRVCAGPTALCFGIARFSCFFCLVLPRDFQPRP